MSNCDHNMSKQKALKEIDAADCRKLCSVAFWCIHIFYKVMWKIIT